ncbi:ABC transporter permease [Agromyces sp. SYSU T00194]|uniref:ABC transporter permease n=1 Tax=Agromyces chitinivorans TaxID=3158560 RepID=UPI003399F20F
MTTATATPAQATTRHSGGGFRAVLGVQLRTGWKAPVIWVAGLVGGYLATVAAVDGTYPTPEQLATYDATVASDPAMAAINGTPYGADTLGGVAANEFGFIAAIAVPLMGLFLVTRQTRALEETGLLELLRSRAVGRRAPWSAAVLVALVALTLVGAGMAAVLLAYGEPADAAWRYGASMAGLGAVFAGLATFVGQLVRRAAGVTAVGIVVLGGAYLLRAVGDVRDNAWKWLSPLAWQQETRPFTDDPRIWPLLLALGVAAALVVAGLALVGGRDLGAAVVPSRTGPRRAGRFQASTLGLAVRAHVPAGVGWIAGAAVVGVVFGAFTDDIADAVAANPALAGMLGADAADSVNESYAGLTLLILAYMAIGCLVQAIGRLRAEETGGRLEPTLARAVRRSGWLGTHALTAAVLACLVLLAGGAGLAWTSGDRVDGVAAATIAYLPALLVFGGVGMLLLGALPRFTSVLWLFVAYAVFADLLGGTLSMPDQALALSPTHVVGDVPATDVDGAAEAWLGAVAAATALVGLLAFRRRDVPS